MASLPAASPPAALVTGGARRIGRAIVLALARSGYAVAIHANRSLKAAAELRDNVARVGGAAGGRPAALADRACPRALPPAVGPPGSHLRLRRRDASPRTAART